MILIPPTKTQMIMIGTTILSPNIGKAKLLKKYKAILIKIDNNRYFFM